MKTKDIRHKIAIAKKTRRLGTKKQAERIKYFEFEGQR